jgi:hypothetical protein
MHFPDFGKLARLKNFLRRDDRAPQAAPREMFTTFDVEELEDRTLLSGAAVAPPAQEAEPNDTMGAATELGAPSNTSFTVSGSIETKGDVDLYEIDLQAGDLLSVAVSTHALSSGLDTSLRVFADNGNEVFFDDDGGVGTDSSLTARIAATGTYYIGVSSHGNDRYDPHITPSTEGLSSGDYTLSISNVNDRFASAVALGSPMESGIDLSGSIQSASEIDFYSIDLQAGQLFSAEITRPTGSSLDSRITLYDALGRQVAFANNQSRTDLDAGMVFGVETSGHYYLQVDSGIHPDSRHPEAIGDYSLRLNSRSPTISGSLVAETSEASLVTFVQQGRLEATATVDGGLGQIELRLLTEDGRLIATSSADAGPPRISQLIAAGNYRLQVVATTDAGAAYRIDTWFVAQSAAADSVPLAMPSSANAVVADFNGDGWSDLAMLDNAGMSVVLGRGNGSFTEARLFDAGLNARSLALGDFNGDGRIDLAIGSVDRVNFKSGISILLGRGDGAFAVPNRIAIASPEYQLGSYSLSAGDFNGDGRLDLAAVSYSSLSIDNFAAELIVLLGAENGTFIERQRLAVGNGGASNLVNADFDRDGKLDLAFINPRSVQVSLLSGQGDGTFADQRRLATGDVPIAPGPGGFGGTNGDGPGFLTLGDFNSDGLVDFAMASTYINIVSVRLGVGDGTFSDRREISIDGTVGYLTSGDLNGDGRLDLVTANSGLTAASVLLGRGDGSFFDQQDFVVGNNPGFVGIRDFNDDGFVDLAVVSTVSAEMIMLLGRGDGSFLDFRPFASSPVGTNPRTVVKADFNGDGRIDLAVVNLSSDNLSILLGRGDGSFAEQQRFSVGENPESLVVGDFNGDGRPDLAVADTGSYPIFSTQISVLLGRGDGSFTEERRFTVGNGPRFITTGDFNGDSRTDLAVTNQFSGDFSILLSHGDGSFTEEQRTPAGVFPVAAVAGDFNGDGRTDLIVTTAESVLGDQSVQPQDKVSVLLGLGDGSFGPSLRLSPFLDPVFLNKGDFNGDGRLDLLVVNRSDNNVAVLLGNGDGSFAEKQRATVAQQPFSVNVADFNGDGQADLIVASSFSKVSLLLGLGDGSFDTFKEFSVGFVGDSVYSVAAADFNGDGRIDVAAALSFGSFVTVLFGDGAGNLSSNTATSFRNVTSSPIAFSRLTTDTYLDTLTLDRSGRLLLRSGTDGAGGFSSPVVLNGSGPAALDFGVARSSTGTVRVATVDKTTDRLSVYTLTASGTVANFASLAAPAGSLLARITTGDVNGDSREDLVVTNPGRGEVHVLLAGTDGSFGSSTWTAYAAGNGPFEVTLADIDGVQGLDLVVANQVSSDVSVRLNDGAGNFGAERRYRASTGPFGFGTDQLTNRAAVESIVQTNDVAVADFDGDGKLDLLTVNTQGHTFALLSGLGDGRFAAPRETLVSGAIKEVAVGDFNWDGKLDVAFLDQERALLLVYASDGHGGWQAPLTIAAGNLPTSLLAQDVVGPTGTADGKLDLIVGNEFGDVMTFQGNGDGTFRSFVRAATTVTLAVADLDGDGKQDVVTANAGLDRVSVGFGTAGTEVTTAALLQRSSGLLAPGAVQLVDVTADGKLDLLIANGGGNEVLVYRGLGNNQFEAIDAGNVLTRKVFVGTNPVGITVQDLNGDGLQDLVVANQGSNDVSILLNQGTSGGAWQGFKALSRLSVGNAPVSTTLQDVDRDGLTDLLVTNAQDGTVQVLPGRSGGFFSDVPGDTRFINLGGATSGQGTVFTGTLGFAALADGRVARFDLSLPNVASSTVDGLTSVRWVDARTFTGGDVVLAAATDRGIRLLTSADGNLFASAATLADVDASSLLLELAGTRGVRIYAASQSEQGEDLVTIFDAQLDSTALAELRTELNRDPFERLSTGSSFASAGPLGFGILALTARLGVLAALRFDPLLVSAEVSTAADRWSDYFTELFAEATGRFRSWVETAGSTVGEVAQLVDGLLDGLDEETRETLLQGASQGGVLLVRPALPIWSVIEATWRWWAETFPEATDEAATDKPAAEKPAANPAPQPNGNPPAADPTDGAQRKAVAEPLAVAATAASDSADSNSERAAFDAASPRTQRIAARIRRELRRPDPQARDEDERAVAPFTTTHLQGRALAVTAALALSVGFGNRRTSNPPRRDEPAAVEQ